VGRPEERLSRGGAPVDQQPASRRVSKAQPSDVHGIGVVRADDAPEAQVQAEAPQQAQASAQPVDLHIPVHRRLAYAAGRPALGIEAVGQVGDRLLEALRDGREVPLIAGDQRRVRLGGEAVRKVKRTGSQGVHGISSDLRSLAAIGSKVRSGAKVPAQAITSVPITGHTRISRPPFRSVLAPACDYAARPGSCGKPPGALYVENGEVLVLSFFFDRRPWMADPLAKRRYRPVQDDLP
jgi:hypothetical protein